MNAPQWLMILLIFGCVMALVMGVYAVLGGATAQRLRTRLLALRDEGEEGDQSDSVIRARYLRQLPPGERWLEQRPGMAVLGKLIAQAGRSVPAYRVALLSLALMFGGAIVAGVLSKSWLGALAGAVAGLVAPVIRLRLERERRVALFEDQLPDALDLMSRSLRAGNPLMESLRFVGDEMHPPLSTDFNLAWSHINYGVSLKVSLLDLLERAPLTSLRAMVTAILVQRETGGNLAEILDKITTVLRGRAKFRRRLRTLSAEGRMSAVVLVSMPFVLSGILTVSSPTYLPLLTGDPLGRKMVAASLIMMSIGMVWVSRIVKIRV
jgi:tight adherence protein B